jgi:hypothetical protein
MLARLVQVGPAERWPGWLEVVSVIEPGADVTQEQKDLYFGLTPEKALPADVRRFVLENGSCTVIVPCSLISACVRNPA